MSQSRRSNGNQVTEYNPYQDTDQRSNYSRSRSNYTPQTYDRLQQKFSQNQEDHSEYIGGINALKLYQIPHNFGARGINPQLWTLQIKLMLLLTQLSHKCSIMKGWKLLYRKRIEWKFVPIAVGSISSDERKQLSLKEGFLQCQLIWEPVRKLPRQLVWELLWTYAPPQKGQQMNADLEGISSPRIEYEKQKLNNSNSCYLPPEREPNYQESSIPNERPAEVQVEVEEEDNTTEKLESQDLRISETVKTGNEPESISEMAKTPLTESLIQDLHAPTAPVQVLDQELNKDVKPFLYYVYGGNYPEQVVNALQARGNWVQSKEEENIEKCHFLWRPFNYGQAAYKRIDKRIVRNPQPFVYNHLETLKGLTTKSGLIRSLKQYYFNNDLARQAGYSVFDSTATTFLLSAGVEDSEQSELIQRYKDIQKGHVPKERIPLKHCVNNIWLVKPSNANQGRGIEIFSDLDDMLNFINQRPMYTCCVVQKYIERPLLYKQRKFDIRVWALVTAKNELFFYKPGYLRTSSDDYSLSNGNNYVHLTNNCLQKHGENYGAHEDGNTIGYQYLQQYLDENFKDYNLSVEQHLIPRMKDLVIDTFLSTKQQLNPNRRKNVFELLGYDFLIDEDFRIWLIEVNTNPYLGIPNNYIAKLLPKMMDDLFDIVLDPIYKPIFKPETLVQLIKGGLSTLPSIPSLSSPNKQDTKLPEQFPFIKLLQQDIKFLRQFKIPTNISTVTVKPKEIKSPEKKHSLRSKSQLNMSTCKPVKRSPSITKQKSTTNNINTSTQQAQLKYLQPTVTSTQRKSLANNKTPKATNIKASNGIENSIMKSKPMRANSQIKLNQGKRDSSKSDRYNGSNLQNTTKETSNGLNSNTSSVDRLRFQFKDLYFENMDSSPTRFESLFQQVIDVIKIEGYDLIKVQQHVDIINLITKSEKLTLILKEDTFTEIMSLLLAKRPLPVPIQVALIEVMSKAAMRLTAKQILIKNKYMSQLLVVFKKCQDKRVMSAILKVIYNVSCVPELKNQDDKRLVFNPEMSPSIGGSKIEGVLILKQTLLKRTFDKGLIILLLAFNLTNRELQKQLKNVFKIEQFHILKAILELELENDSYKLEEVQNSKNEINEEEKTDHPYSEPQSVREDNAQSPQVKEMLKFKRENQEKQLSLDLSKMGAQQIIQPLQQTSNQQTQRNNEVKELVLQIIDARKTLECVNGIIESLDKEKEQRLRIEKEIREISTNAMIEKVKMEKLGKRHDIGKATGVYHLQNNSNNNSTIKSPFKSNENAVLSCTHKTASNKKNILLSYQSNQNSEEKRSHQVSVKSNQEEPKKHDFSKQTSSLATYLSKNTGTFERKSSNPRNHSLQGGSSQQKTSNTQGKDDSKNYKRQKSLKRDVNKYQPILQNNSNSTTHKNQIYKRENSHKYYNDVQTTQNQKVQQKRGSGAYSGTLFKSGFFSDKHKEPSNFHNLRYSNANNEDQQFFNSKFQSGMNNTMVNNKNPLSDAQTITSDRVVETEVAGGKTDRINNQEMNQIYQMFNNVQEERSSGSDKQVVKNFFYPENGNGAQEVVSFGKNEQDEMAQVLENQKNTIKGKILSLKQEYQSITGMAKEGKKLNFIDKVTTRGSQKTSPKKKLQQSSQKKSQKKNGQQQLLKRSRI